MSKKSLLISEIFPPTNGGSGRWFWELYTRLPRNEYMIVAGKTEGDTDFDKTHNLNLTRTNLSSPSWGIKSLTGLKFYWRLFNKTLVPSLTYRYFDLIKSLKNYNYLALITIYLLLSFTDGQNGFVTSSDNPIKHG